MEVWRKAKDAVSGKAHALWLEAKGAVSAKRDVIRTVWPKAKQFVIERAPGVFLITLAVIAASYLVQDDIRGLLWRAVGGMPTHLLVKSMDDDIAGGIIFSAILLVPFVGVFIQCIALLAGVPWGEDGIWLYYTMDFASKATTLFILPLYFYFESKERSTAVRIRPSYSLRIILPWNLGAIRMDGQEVRLLTAKGVLRGLAAFVTFYSLIGATTTAAVMAARLQLLERLTVRRLLKIAAATSLIFCAPRFLLPPMNSFNSNRAIFTLFALVIPAVIATVNELDTWDVFPMEDSMWVLDTCSFIIWNVIFGWAVKFR